jgi:Leucine-rich repeat (LRR) protein
MGQTLAAQISVPVFTDRNDSMAYANLQAEIQKHFAPGRSRTLAKIDSLFSLQRALRDKIIGYKTIYAAHRDFTPFEHLLNGMVDPDTVTKLSFSGKSLSKLPTEIYQCSNLVELEILNSSIRKLPRKLNSLHTLRAIYIYNNGTRLKLSRNSHVTGLVIRGTEQKNLPLKYRNFATLDSLDLSQNIGLDRFPDIYKNKKLRKLTLIQNVITLNDLKEGAEVSSLEEIHLQRNRITTVPDGIGRFTGLKKLTLNYNQIVQVQPGLGQLKKLEELSLYQNKLQEIPPGIYELNSMKAVDLYYNQIQQVNPRISNLRNLQILYLSNNQITSLPESLGEMNNLYGLYLHNNKISYLPEKLAALSNLKVLRINNNQFTSFPQPVLALIQLENLDISGNNLSQSPIELSGFKKLQILVLSENPWENQEDVQSVTHILQTQGTIVHQ